MNSTSGSDGSIASGLSRQRSLHQLAAELLDGIHGGLIDFLMAESAYLLFVLRFLREADMPDSEFDLVLKSKRSKQLRDLPGVLGSSEHQ